jgi:hypothetical protein
MVPRMIATDAVVVGVDPGAVDTGIAVIQGAYGRPPRLLASATIHRPRAGEDLLDVPPAYLRDVLSTILEAIRDFDADRVAVEGVKRPSWRVNGKVKPLDPTAIMATSIVLGAILGRAWSAELVVVPVGRNGNALPLTAYPAPLATNGKGMDKRRHERSAVDVALRALRVPRGVVYL